MPAAWVLWVPKRAKGHLRQFAGSETSQEESQAEESAAPEEETQEDALSGELTISVKFPTSESSGLGMVAAEFAEQHTPG